jgi:hypothetical protein
LAAVTTDSRPRRIAAPAGVIVVGVVVTLLPTWADVPFAGELRCGMGVRIRVVDEVV